MTTLNLQQAMELAVARHRAGDLAAASELYRAVLARQPNHANAMHLLGLVYFHTGNHAAALEWIGRAISLNPSVADYHLNQGVVLDAAGQTQPAVLAYRRAIALRPDIPEAHANLGNVLQKLEMFVESAAASRRALELRADYFEARLNLGNALQEQGKLEEAVAKFEEAARIRPEMPEGHHNLGNALIKQGRIDAAIAAFRRAVECKPDFVPALLNLARLLSRKAKDSPEAADEAVAVLRQVVALAPTDQTQLELAKLLCMKQDWKAAEAAFMQALAINPDLAEAYHGMGIALTNQGRTDRAILSFRRATALRPDDAWGFAYLGLALRQTGEMDGSVAALENAVALSVGNAEFQNNLGVSYQMTVRIGEAIACYERAVAIDPANDAADSNRVYALWFDPEYDAAAILREHRVWNERHAKSVKPFVYSRDLADRNRKRLRIGYVAADLRDHVVGRTAYPLFRECDHERFEIHCYANISEPDAMTERFKSCADGWRDIRGVDDAAVAEMIRADGIDILVDLTLHMGGGRMKLFARRPAPVQVTFGYPGGTGLDAMDWRLTDPYLDPPGRNDRDYAEKSYRLRDSFWCYDAEAMGWEARIPEPGPLPAERNGFVTFGCLNNFAKVNAGVLKLWSRVLREVDGSRLLLLAPAGEARRRVLRQFAELGVDEKRVDFVPHQTRAAYMAEFGRIDICLDTVPYNGHVTSLDSMWMGVPVVSRVGSTVVGRAGFSQLSNLNLAELAAESDDQFVRVAVELAGDRGRLGELRGTLRERMVGSPLGNAKRFAGNVEGAYGEIWGRWVGGEAEG